MRRIYFEAFIGVILLFMGSMLVYELVIYQWNTDYEFILEDHQAEAFQGLITTIAEAKGVEPAITALQQHADKTRNILQRFDSDALPSDVYTHLIKQTNSMIYHDNDRHLWLRLNGTDDVFKISADENSPLRQHIDFDNTIIWLFFLIAFALYCIIFCWSLSRRFHALEKVTLAFASGDFSVRASLKSGKKLGSLNRSFNHMIDKISSLVTSNRALTNAVAHELRTPIFRIQWQAEILADTPLSPTQEAGIASIIEDTEEMEEMVDELLHLARVERADAVLNCQEISINTWFTAQLQRWNKETDKSIELVLLAQENRLNVDAELLKRACDNLVRNAYRFAEQQVQVQLSMQGSELVIAVHDDGEGIEEQHWPFLFDAFYSANSARDKSKSGHGLGLAIVKQIVTRHQGQVSVSRSPLGGAHFNMVFSNQ